MPINQSGLSVNVKVKLANDRIVSSSSSPVKTVKTQFRTVDEISELIDVTGTPQDGFTLVYDSTLGKYVVQQLSGENINLASLDGGNF
jgi:hypothetical protein